MNSDFEYVISDGSDGTPSNIDYSVAKQQVRELRYWQKELKGLLFGDLLTFLEEFPSNKATFDLYFYWRSAVGTGTPIPVLKFVGAVEENIWALRTLHENLVRGHGASSC